MAHPVTIEALRARLDRVPLPAGVERVADDEIPRRADAPAEIHRRYRYTGTARPLCAVLLGGARAAGFALTDVLGNEVDAATCSTRPPNATFSPAGGLAVLTEAGSDATVSLGWIGDTTITLDANDVGS